MWRSKRTYYRLASALGLIVFWYMGCRLCTPWGEYFCERFPTTTVASLGAGYNRVITVLGDNCWEMSRILTYEVREEGNILSAHVYLGTDQGRNHSYSIILADDSSLVGIIDRTVDPAELVIIYDF